MGYRSGIRGIKYRSISGGPGQGPGLQNVSAHTPPEIERLARLTFAWTGHDCGSTVVGDSSGSALVLETATK